MSRKKRSKILDDDEEENISDYPSLNADEVQWNSKQKIALLNSMINLKPAGIHKHLSMLLIRENVSKNLKTNIPSEAIWDFLHSHWKMDIADEIENVTIPYTKQDFSLPNDEDWAQLIEEQKIAINSDKSVNSCDIMYKNLDVKILQTVKVMIEKLDDQNLPLYTSKLNALKNTLESDYSIHDSNVISKSNDNTSEIDLGKSSPDEVLSKMQFTESQSSNNCSSICVKENRCLSLPKKRKLNMSVCSPSLYNEIDNFIHESRRHSLNLLKFPTTKHLQPVNLDVKLKKDMKNLKTINSMKISNCESKIECSSSRGSHSSSVSSRSKMLDSSSLFFEKLIFPETSKYSTNKRLTSTKKTKSMTSKAQNQEERIGVFNKKKN